MEDEEREDSVFDRYSKTFWKPEDKLPLMHWLPTRDLDLLAAAMEKAIASGKALTDRDLERI